MVREMIARCSEQSCPNLIRWDASVPKPQDGSCARCGERYCTEHLSDTDWRGDDGSGRYGKPLPDYYCPTCIEERLIPEEYD